MKTNKALRAVPQAAETDTDDYDEKYGYSAKMMKIINGSSEEAAEAYRDLMILLGTDTPVNGVAPIRVSKDEPASQPLPPASPGPFGPAKK